MPFYPVNTNQLTNDIPPLVRDEGEEIDADYEVIESSILIRSFPEWYAEQIQQTIRELNFDLHLAVCEVEIKNGISASLEPIPLPDLPPDMSIYNLNAILDGVE
ncbi:MAG: hypothetical protein ACRAVC_01910 [Trichormus sp.]